jgi:hypothetical protein
MCDFDERDLLRHAEQAGFCAVRMDAHFEVMAYPESRSSARGQSDTTPPVDSWEVFVRAAPNPLSPTLAEAMASALSREEADRFTAHLRPLVESMQLVHRMEYAYLWAAKQGSE